MSGPALLYDRKGGTAVVTLNRPEVHDALNADMLARLFAGR
jgi:enoyl-CoA hydratase/carnithine racemase